MKSNIPNNLDDLRTNPDMGTREHFDDLVAFAIEAAEKTCASQKYQSIAPMLDVLCFDPETKEQSRLVFTTPEGFDETDEKTIFMKTAAHQIFSDKKVPLMACLTSEAWLAKMTEKEAHSPARPQPRDYHSKQEIVVIFACDLLGRWSAVADGPLVRGHGNIIQPTKITLKPDEYGHAESPLVKKLFQYFLQECR